MDRLPEIRRFKGAIGFVAAVCLALAFATSLGVGAAGAANVPQQWTTSLSNADASAISCPSTGTCYAVGEAVEATSDSGQTWSASSIPATAQALTGISCPSVTTCDVIGYDLDEYQTDPMPEYSETGVAYRVTFSSGVPTWTQEVLPRPAGDSTMPSFSTISCPSTATCYIGSEPSETANQSEFYATTDGGTDVERLVK